MRALRLIDCAALLTLLAACGGGGSGGKLTPGTGTGPPSFTSVKQVRVSQPATFGACSGAAQPGTLYSGTALEPSLVVNPTNTANLIAAWQQDRWSTGGSQALNLGASFDGGMTWLVTNAAFSVCSGGSAGNAGNYLRASNGWLTVSTTGLVYALSLSFSGSALQTGSSSAQLVARSVDGGNTWSTPVALIADGSSFFNDKGSITADPFDSGYVYAVWDRLSKQNVGPTYFALTSDTGNSWQAAGSIYDPGPTNQTIGNIIVVLPGDTLLDIFTELDTASDGSVTALLRSIRSTDHGTTWSAPVTIAADEAVGTTDPLSGAAIRDSSDLFSASVSSGGTIYLVWQDARFSGGDHDGVALSSSGDGGQTWATPIQINGEPNAPAFTPTVNVRADGVIGVSYYDLRNDTLPGSVMTDCWMVTSSDGTHFEETHLSGPFNLDLAPQGEFGPNNTLGLFLGDYQALISSGGAFLPLYAQTNTGSSAASSDVFIAFPPATAAAQSLPGAARAFRAFAAPTGVTLTPAASARVMARIRRMQAERLPGGG
jgi:hypothetical protein